MSAPAGVVTEPASFRASLLAALSAVWGVLLLGILVAAPSSGKAGADQTRDTVRLALVYYFAAVLVMVWLDQAGWRAATLSGASARLCWSLGWLAYLLHVGLAFHHYH